MTVDEMMALARHACAEEFLRGQHVGTPGYREHRYGTEAALAQIEAGARGAAAAERERVSVVYMTCAKHMGQPWTMTTTAVAPLRQVCPLCERSNDADERKPPAAP